MKYVEPAKTVLLVIDMQKDFYAESYNASRRGKPVKQMQALPDKINKFATKLRNAGAKVVFTKFIYDPERSPANYTEMIRSTKNSNWMCEVGSEGAELAGVEVKDQDIIIEKFSYDGFAGTNLLQLLKDWNIENVVVTGVRAEVCVLATVARSFAEGFSTFVMSDLVGTYDDKQATASTVLDILRYSSYVMESKDLPL